MTTPLRALLVEDSDADIALLERTLNAERFSIDLTIARTGAEAVSAYRNAPSPFELILLDISLPDIDGMDALDEMRGDGFPDGMVIVALTGMRDPGFLHVARERGVHALLTKPLRLIDLIDVLRDYGYWTFMARKLSNGA